MFPVTDDDLLDIKPKMPPPEIKNEPAEERRVVRRIGTLGSAELEKEAMVSEKEKYLKGNNYHLVESLL